MRHMNRLDGVRLEWGAQQRERVWGGGYRYAMLVARDALDRHVCERTRAERGAGRPSHGGDAYGRAYVTP